MDLPDIAGDHRSPLQLMPIAGGRPNPSVIAISPTGSSAAIYDPLTRSAQVIGNLPQAAEVVREFDLSAIPGQAVAMALSDDGTILLVHFADDSVEAVYDRPHELWITGPSGSRLLGTRGSAAAAFFPNRHDAVVADEAAQGVFLVTDISQSDSRFAVISVADGLESFSSLAVSGDGNEVSVADPSGKIAIVDMQTLRPELVDCHCRPSGLYRLKGRSIFQLTQASDEPVTVLDHSSGEPRIFIIPPKSPDGTEAAQ